MTAANALFQSGPFVKAVFTFRAAFPLTAFIRLFIFPIFKHLTAALAVLRVKHQPGVELPAAPLALLFHAPDAVFSPKSALRGLPVRHHSFPVACFSSSSQISCS